MLKAGVNPEPVIQRDPNPKNPTDNNCSSRISSHTHSESVRGEAPGICLSYVTRELDKEIREPKKIKKHVETLISLRDCPTDKEQLKLRQEMWLSFVQKLLSKNGLFLLSLLYCGFNFPQY